MTTLNNQDRSTSSAVRLQSEIFSHEGELVWSIKDFSKFKDKIHSSNEFSIVPRCQMKWEIFLEIKDSIAETQIKVLRKDQMVNAVLADIKCSLKNSQGVEYMSYALKQIYYGGQYRYEVYLERSVKEKDPSADNEDTIMNWDLTSLQDNLLIVELQIKLQDCCTKTEMVKNEYQNSFPRHKLSTDLHRGLKMLLDEKPLSDVNFNVCGTIIPAHKAILCARSPVFRKELESDMKEAIGGVIEINDIQPDIMKEFVSYLYTDTFGKEISLDVIRELYSLADKYQVGSLQDKCGSVLLENLNDKNVCKTLKLADLHNDDILKEAASMYIGGNYPGLKHTLDFKSLVESDPRLVLHILMCKCLE